MIDWRDALGAVEVPCVKLDEQREVVRSVDALLGLAEAVERHVSAATAHADKLTQAILAKAFRGELVPTEAELARRKDRDYESASALLERVRGRRETDGAVAFQAEEKAARAGGATFYRSRRTPLKGFGSAFWLMSWPVCATFAELKRLLGSGESAAVAAAFHRNLAIATDDGRTRREIAKRLGPGRLLTTPGILLRAIRGGLMTVQEADAIKAELEKNRFRMSFESFSDLI